MRLALLAAGGLALAACQPMPPQPMISPFGAPVQTLPQPRPIVAQPINAAPAPTLTPPAAPLPAPIIEPPGTDTRTSGVPLPGFEPVPPATLPAL